MDHQYHGQELDSLRLMANQMMNRDIAGWGSTSDQLRSSGAEANNQAENYFREMRGMNQETPVDINSLMQLLQMLLQSGKLGTMSPRGIDPSAP